MLQPVDMGKVFVVGNEFLSLSFVDMCVNCESDFLIASISYFVQVSRK